MKNDVPQAQPQPQTPQAADILFNFTPHPGGQHCVVAVTCGGLMTQFLIPNSIVNQICDHLKKCRDDAPRVVISGGVIPKGPKP